MALSPFSCSETFCSEPAAGFRLPATRSPAGLVDQASEGRLEYFSICRCSYRGHVELIVNLTEYHDALRNDEHMIVVQAARPLAGGIFTSIEVDGFVICADGSRRPLTEEETWEFI